MPSLTFFLYAATILLSFSSGAAGQSQPAGEWRSLFDGKTMQGWRETAFTGKGEVRVEKGTLILNAGQPLTGANLTTSFPQSNYEVRFEASRIVGGDFFAGLTFPVKDSFCTLVTGGWGGDIVGLSNIDEWDASSNETRTYVNFEPGRWYAFRLQVTDDRIRVWIDEQKLIDVVITGRTISLRPGPINLSAPFGFASYNSTGAIRRIEYRPLQGRTTGDVAK